MTTQSTVIIGLSNPKSPTNVGAVMRAAGCYNATQVRYNGTRYNRAVKFQTDTHNSKARISLVEMEDLTADLAPDVEIVCVELVVGATALPQFVHPQNAIYLFGPEDGSLPQDVVDQAHHVVYVPTNGQSRQQKPFKSKNARIKRKRAERPFCLSAINTSGFHFTCCMATQECDDKGKRACFARH
ncbi:hypothetical protein DM784_17330 [Vibrio furnissii]|nr:RNA methyltransferase [Vibrio furnissii]TRN22238.1 hypothetical protein DM784_17330 [Vibrio furnissii]